GFLADAFECFRRHGLSVDLVTTSETNVTVSLDPKANALDEATIDALLADLNEFCDAREIGPCAVVSLVGRHIRSILHELGPALEVFDEQYVYLVSQAASDLNFSFVVDEDQADRLVTELHALLFGERRASSLFGPSWEELTSDGDDGAQLPDAWWVDRRDELLEITEDGTPVWVYSPDAVHNRIDALDTLDSVDRTLYAVKANDNPDLLRLIEDRGLGFECVSPGEVELILELFPEIDRSRVLFTPNFAPRTEYREALEAGVHVTVDSLHPLAEWPELFEDREIFLRFDPGRGRGHHEYVRTGGPRSK
ncbi:MAG: bifunctional aspartate kinase/diaminopimelate decarboxylase, partial [Bradymonadaceae bacterium]